MISNEYYLHFTMITQTPPRTTSPIREPTHLHFTMITQTRCM